MYSRYRTWSLLNSSPPSAAYMRQWTESALVQVMACHLFGVKPLHKPMLTYCQLNPQEQTSVKFESTYKTFHSRKCIWEKSSVKWWPFCKGKWVDTIRWLLLVFQSWHPVMQSSLYNSFDDWAPVHEICGSLIFKWDPLNRHKFRAPVLWDIPCWTHKLHEKRQKCDEQIDKAIPIPYPTTLAGVKK